MRSQSALIEGNGRAARSAEIRAGDMSGSPGGLEVVGAEDELARYRLMVVAPDIAELVTVAGGWIFDRAMAGWDVTALVNEGSDVRPLRILGVVTASLESALSTDGPVVQPSAISIAGHYFSSDPRIRDLIRRIAGGGATELTVWGDACPSDFRASLRLVSYEPTSAARVFKKHALAAAGCLDRAVEPNESFGVVSPHSSTLTVRS